MTSILIARITGAHGIRGAVKLISFAADPKAIATYGALQTKDGRSFEVLRMKPARDEFIADLKDVRDRNQAEALKGVELFVARDKLPKLSSKDFYLADLIGKDVIADGASIGTVTSIENYGAGDLMELASGALVPVRFVETVTNVVTVVLPPGYLDPATHEDQHH